MTAITADTVLVWPKSEVRPRKRWPRKPPRDPRDNALKKLIKALLATFVILFSVTIFYLSLWTLAWLFNEFAAPHSHPFCPFNLLVDLML